MTNNFIAEYNELKNIRSAYDSAETEVEKNAARGDFKAFKERIAAKGSDYSKYFWIFEDAWRRGNNYIDFNDVIRRTRAIRPAARQDAWGTSSGRSTTPASPGCRPG